MFYNNFEEPNDQSFLYKIESDESQSFLSFKKDIIKESKSNNISYFLYSNDFNDLYYIKDSPKIELDEIKEKNAPPNKKEKENPNNEIPKTKTTAFKTLLPVIHKKKEKIIIFEIKKEKKSLLGRKRKNQLSYNNNENDNVHTKDKKDDMFTKLKRNAYYNSLDCLNYKLSKSKNKNLKSIKLKKIDNSAIIVSKKEENQDLFKTELKDLFSNNISKKYKHDNPDYNKKKINYILQQKDKEINNALKKDF
jgi:hypothetical protein